MKYVWILIFVLGFSAYTNAQTKPATEAEGFTCYTIDEYNMHCYLEESDADLDFNNDGVLDREYNKYELDENLTDDDDKGIIDDRNYNGIPDVPRDTSVPEYKEEGWEYQMENDDGIIQDDLPYKDPKENDPGL